jgi:hypothetical protein
MEAIKMGHFSVMTMTVKAMYVRKWTDRNLMRYGAVIPRFIVTMDDATQFMLNSKREAFYMMQLNGDVDPVVITPGTRPIHTRHIETPEEAAKVLREWYEAA